ncbi:MAG: type II/IV secretion system ATPase subunit [Candidatus Methanomethylicia archaeon]
MPLFRLRRKAVEKIIVEEAKPKVTGELVFKDFYLVKPPYTYAGIVIEPDGKLKYYVIEPDLLPNEVIAINRIKNILREEAAEKFERIEEVDVRKWIEEKTKAVIKDYRIGIAKEAIDKILYYVFRDLLEYGKLECLIRDPNIEDISCDGVNIPVYVWHRLYETLPTNIVFESVDELNSMIVRLAYKAGQQISIAKPIVEGSIPEGYRIHLTLEEVSKKGSTFTIRKFREEPFTIIDLINYGTISTDISAYLWILIENIRSAMICGATASGKTTLLNAIATFIRPESKIITIEETRELRLPHENWIPLVTRPSFQPGVQDVTLFDLLKSSLRMRPDYIIVGEVRGEEAYTFFQALSVGHGGLCTIHAEGIEVAIRRLETKPMDIPRQLIPLINTLILTGRTKIGGDIKRRVLNVVEIVDVDPRSNEVIMNPLFKWDALSDSFTYTGKSYILNKIASIRQISPMEVLDEYKRRIEVLKWMIKNNIRSFGDVSKIIRAFYYNPKSIYERVRIGIVE